MEADASLKPLGRLSPFVEMRCDQDALASWAKQSMTIFSLFTLIQTHTAIRSVPFSTLLSSNGLYFRDSVIHVPSEKAKLCLLKTTNHCSQFSRALLTLFIYIYIYILLVVYYCCSAVFQGMNFRGFPST